MMCVYSYLAEYGLEGVVSTKCYIYNFGIMLMEVCTRMKPNGEMLSDNLTLKFVILFLINWLKIIDSNLWVENEEYITEKLECIRSMMEVALNWLRESPKERHNWRCHCYFEEDQAQARALTIL